MFILGPRQNRQQLLRDSSHGCGISTRKLAETHKIFYDQSSLSLLLISCRPKHTTEKHKIRGQASAYFLLREELQGYLSKGKGTKKGGALAPQKCSPEFTANSAEGFSSLVWVLLLQFLFWPHLSLCLSSRGAFCVTRDKQATGLPSAHIPASTIQPLSMTDPNMEILLFQIPNHQPAYFRPERRFQVEWWTQIGKTGPEKWSFHWVPPTSRGMDSWEAGRLCLEVWKRCLEEMKASITSHMSFKGRFLLSTGLLTLFHT